MVARHAGGHPGNELAMRAQKYQLSCLAAGDQVEGGPTALQAGANLVRRMLKPRPPRQRPCIGDCLASIPG